MNTSQLLPKIEIPVPTYGEGSVSLLNFCFYYPAKSERALLLSHDLFLSAGNREIIGSNEYEPAR